VQQYDCNAGHNNWRSKSDAYSHIYTHSYGDIHADTDRYVHSNGNGYIHAYTYADGDSHAHTHADGDGYSYGYIHAYTYANGYSHADAYTNGDGNIYAYTYADSYPHANAHANANTQPNSHGDSNWDTMYRNHQPVSTAGQHGKRRSGYCFLLPDHSN
jgi:hypothetical protein